MSIYLILGLILLISLLALWAKRRGWSPFCPICTGVSLTWLLLLGARVVGYYVDPVVLGMLMGGSVVGVEGLLAKREGQSSPWRKIVFILAGFGLVYGVVEKQFWFGLASGLIFVLVLVLYLSFGKSKEADQQKVDDLKNKIKDCC